jgi:hypothetical protein
MSKCGSLQDYCIWIFWTSWVYQLICFIIFGEVSTIIQIFCLFFWDMVSLCISGWSWTYDPTALGFLVCYRHVLLCLSLNVFVFFVFLRCWKWNPGSLLGKCSSTELLPTPHVFSFLLFGTLIMHTLNDDPNGVPQVSEAMFVVCHSFFFLFFLFFEEQY